MNRMWEPILRDLTEATQPRQLVEIGVASGLLTAKLLDYCLATGALLHAIDPAPQLDVADWRERYQDSLIFHRARSLEVLEDLHEVDVAYIDGDHNWFSVYNEMRQLERTALTDQRVPPLVTLHDVGWPYGRRDLYYDPDTIPESHRQPYRKLGLMPGEAKLVQGGMNGELNNAIHHGTPRNGVRTAVEDFVAESELEWLTVYIPGFHGLGIAVAKDRLADNPRLSDAIESLRTAEFLEKRAEELELARVRIEIEAGRQLDEQRELLERQAIELTALHRSAHELYLAQQEIHQLRAALLSAEHDITRLHQLEADYAEFEQLTEQLRANRDDILRRYNVVLRSRSWKVTEPMRRVGILARRVRG